MNDRRDAWWQFIALLLLLGMLALLWIYLDALK